MFCSAVYNYIPVVWTNIACSDYFHWRFWRYISRSHPGSPPYGGKFPPGFLKTMKGLVPWDSYLTKNAVDMLIMNHDFETELKLKKMQSKTTNKHVLLGMGWVFGNVTCMIDIFLHIPIFKYIYIYKHMYVYSTHRVIYAYNMTI